MPFFDTPFFDGLDHRLYSIKLSAVYWMHNLISVYCALKKINFSVFQRPTTYFKTYTSYCLRHQWPPPNESRIRFFYIPKLLLLSVRRRSPRNLMRRGDRFWTHTVHENSTYNKYYERVRR